MSTLFQLVYTSIKKPSCDETEINKILSSCKKNNGALDITGVLLHSQSSFIQYLEGPKEIIKLYDQIKEDNRHKDVVLLSYKILNKRYFPSWQMGYKNITHKDLELMTTTAPEDKKIFSSIIYGEKVNDSSAIKMITNFFQK